MGLEGVAADAQNCRACPDIKKWAASLIRSAFHPRQAEWEKLECPPNADQIGSSTWTFLHSMSVYYPERPSTQQQQDMQQFMHLFSRLYPCKPCAEHVQEYLKSNPPTTENRATFSDWMCRLHNEVNERLGKPYFDCTKIMERWRTGCQDSPQTK